MCASVFRNACDDLIHETLHVCPGCECGPLMEDDAIAANAADGQANGSANGNGQRGSGSGTSFPGAEASAAALHLPHQLGRNLL